MPPYSNNKSLFPMQGGCPCGRTRYQLNLAPLLVHCCHCTLCQRQLGTAFAVNAIVESSAVTLLAPSPPSIPGCPDDPSTAPCSHSAVFSRLTSASDPDKNNDDDCCGRETVSRPPTNLHLVCLPTPSGVGQTTAQCPTCRTTLWSHYADAGPHTLYLRVGTLDCPWEVTPDVHIFTRSKPSFVVLPDDSTPKFPGYYPDRAELCRDDVLPRLRALDEKKAAYKAALLQGLDGSDN